MQMQVEATSEKFGLVVRSDVPFWREENRKWYVRWSGADVSDISLLTKHNDPIMSWYSPSGDGPAGASRAPLTLF
tara:strand:+ start:99 stop:323 length:225 start_codon:yes stop_codon:yes gene_type:complete